jgi:hypothetical protein
MFLRKDDLKEDADLVSLDRLELAVGRSPVPEESWDEVDRLFLGGR